MTRHMNWARSAFAAALLAMTGAPMMAQAAPVAPAATAAETAAPAVAANAADAAVAAPERTKPTQGVGMPRPGELALQDQYNVTGQYARWIHDSVLLPIITVISIFVLGLLLWIIVRYRRAANPVPSKTAHNTALEIAWTLIPVLILVGIAVPSISLIAKQYKPAPKDALTIKVTGYQWYWGYEYPDNEIPEFVSNMLPPEKAVANGEPNLLAVDNRMVVPVGKPIKLIITGADVIHSFAVPSLWVKMDAVPGRLNEKTFQVDRPGVYYGQCSELCGARHAFMPIAVEALPADKFEQWVRSQGGKMPGDAEAVPAAGAPAVDAPPAPVAETAVAAPAKTNS